MGLCSPEWGFAHSNISARDSETDRGMEAVTTGKSVDKSFMKRSRVALGLMAHLLHHAEAKGRCHLQDKVHKESWGKGQMRVQVRNGRRPDTVLAICSNSISQDHSLHKHAFWSQEAAAVQRGGCTNLYLLPCTSKWLGAFAVSRNSIRG